MSINGAFDEALITPDDNAAAIESRRLKRAVVLIVATAFFVFTSLGTVIIPILP